MQVESKDQVNPRELKIYFKQNLYHEKFPSLYDMVCWITDACEAKGQPDVTFEEFMDAAVFFFSQRSHQEGLQYIFGLLDKDQKGYIERD